MTDFFAPAGRGVQHASLRAANRRAVLTTITFNPGLSNADVSRRTGLAPQTASAIVSELEVDGLVTRGDVLRGRRGQPATPLFLNQEAAYSIGCEVGWEHVDIMLIDMGSREIGRYRREYAYPDAGTIVAEIGTAIADLCARLTETQRAKLVGIGLSSPTRIGRGIRSLPAPPEQAAAWEALDLRARIEAVSGLSTTWLNDGNAACWAAMLWRSAPRPSNFVYLHVGTFLGAGIVAEHTLWEGPTGNSADLGSMLVSSAEGRYQSGHAIASTTALRRKLQKAGIAIPVGPSDAWPWQDWEPVLAEWLAEAGRALAKIVLNTSAVIEITEAMIDGDLPPDVRERLVAATRAGVEELPLLAFVRPNLTAGVLGSRAAALGSAQMPLFRKYLSREITDMLDSD